MNRMSCESVQERMSSLLDGMTTAGEREEVMAHLAQCRPCGVRLKSLESLRASLRSLDRPRIPEGLVYELRVLASHERVRRLACASLSTRLQYWTSRARLRFDNLMRPVALPIA